MAKLFRTAVPALTAAAAISVFTAFPASAAIRGNLDSVSAEGISGWAWETDDYDTVVSVEIRIYPEEGDEPLQILSASADEFDQELSDSIGDGWHSFSVPVDWDELPGSSFVVRAYSVMGETREPIGGACSYRPDEDEGERVISGPGDSIGLSDPAEEDRAEADESSDKDGLLLLGAYTVTGYCNCELCSGGHGYTYSGTIPQGNHTLSADLDVLPLGTKVMIDGIVYTVEDMGSGVDGNKVDIYFPSHEEALAYGTQTADVYLLG